MRCSECGYENRPDARFCAACGMKLVNVCRNCNAVLRLGDRYCDACGTSVEHLGTAPQPEPMSGSDLSHPERRQLTVMFCDLVGSTALSSQLDPEDLRDVLRAYQEACAGVIVRYEGFITRYMGDGIMVQFGYPRALEDAAARAVWTGLGIVEAVAVLSNKLNVDLSVRVGIATGVVVAGDLIGNGVSAEQAIVGQTPNLAARLQGIAEPNMVVIAARTRKLVNTLFECDDLGKQELRGVAEPVSAWCVLRPKQTKRNLETRAISEPTLFVGREQEMEFLHNYRQRMLEGVGQVAILSGEPGIGKTRLVKELKARAVQDGDASIEIRCSPYHQNTPLYPIINHLQRFLQVQGEDSDGQKLGKLDRILSRYDLPLEEIFPLFARLLSLPLPAKDYPVLSQSPERQKEKTCQALMAWLFKEAERQPVLLVWEDMHWADPSSLELLTLLINQASIARILVLITMRPHSRLPWPTHSHVTHLPLGHLSREQAEAIVKQTAGGKTLPETVVQQLVEKTDGVPLFVEELTKMVLELADWGQDHEDYKLMGFPTPMAIPDTLQDSLTARLDRLGAAKEVVQLAATLGREFSYKVMLAVSPLDEQLLAHGLYQLVQAGLIRQRDIPPDSSYTFKHGLVQEAAYQSLLKGKRELYHKRIAQVFTEQFPEEGESHPELLAHHFTEAGMSEEAIFHWRRAGAKAMQSSAHMEAITHINKGLKLIKALPEGQCAEQELDLQTTLGQVLMAIKGYAASEVEQAHRRARELCQNMSDTKRLFPVLIGLWVFYTTRGEFSTARKLGEQCLALAERANDPRLLLKAHDGLGATLLFIGEPTLARKHLEQGYAFYDARKRHAPPLVQDAGVDCLSYEARALWFLGYPDQALQKTHEAFSLAQELDHPFSLAFAFQFAGSFYQLRRDAQTALENSEASIVISNEQGFPLPLAWATTLRGWALAELGQQEEGISEIRRGLDAWRDMGARLMVPYFLSLLAEALGQAGKTEDAVLVLNEALELVDRTGEVAWAAELQRLKGELLLKNAKHEIEAETCFRSALDIAHKQQAKSLELRAATSLSRLWRDQDKTEAAQEMLEKRHSWFTEGHDTRDLREANVLLTEIS